MKDREALQECFIFTYTILKRLGRAQNEAFMFSEDIDRLNASLETLTRHEEEGLLALDQLLATKLRTTCNKTAEDSTLFDRE